MLCIVEFYLPHERIRAAAGDVKEVANVNIRININDKGEFTGVIFNNKSYSVNQWNKIQEAKPAGPFKER